MFWIRWLRHEFHSWRIKHRPVWSALHDRVICRCGEDHQPRRGQVKDFEKRDGRWVRVR